MEIEKLSFKDISIGKSGRIEMDVIGLQPGVRQLWFQLPEGTSTHPDLVACAVATIFWGRAQEIEFMLPITQETRKRLTRYSRMTWNAPLLDGDPPRGGDGIVLNFSGGLDSLAALALLGDSTHMVSLDFGERFEREKDFYESFDTNVVSTNAREFDPTWMFMGLGSILLRAELRSDYVAFGSILEASPWHFLRKSKPMSTHAAFLAAGFQSLNPVSGFTEFGTAYLAAKRFPSEMGASLTSLADRHTEKYLRKTMIIEAVLQHTDAEFQIDSLPPEGNKPIKMGTQLTADFLAPGIHKFSGLEKFEEWITPLNGFYQYIDHLSSQFYWRENTDFPLNASAQFRGIIAKNAAELGIQPYNVSDWDEIREVTNFLKFLHKFPGPVW